MCNAIILQGLLNLSDFSVDANGVSQIMHLHTKSMSEKRDKSQYTVRTQMIHWKRTMNTKS